MTGATYHVLSVPLRPEFAELRQPPDMEQPWLIDKGEPYAALAPKAGLTCAMDVDRKGQKLDDFVFNALRWLIVSERVRAVLAQEPGVETLPLHILDRKKKPVAAPYFFVHPTGPEDCVDVKRSEIMWSNMEPTRAHTIKRLVLDPSRIPTARALFRIKTKPLVTIVRSDLVERLKQTGATGYRLLELDSRVLL